MASALFIDPWPHSASDICHCLKSLFRARPTVTTALILSLVHSPAVSVFHLFIEKHSVKYLCVCVFIAILYYRCAQIPGARSSGPLNYVFWRQIFVGPQCSWSLFSYTARILKCLLNLWSDLCTPASMAENSAYCSHLHYVTALLFCSFTCSFLLLKEISFRSSIVRCYQQGTL